MLQNLLFNFVFVEILLEIGCKIKAIEKPIKKGIKKGRIYFITKKMDAIIKIKYEEETIKFIFFSNFSFCKNIILIKILYNIVYILKSFYVKI